MEIPSFFLGVSLFEVIIFGKTTAWVSQTSSIVPHPYWIGIMLFAMAYGLIEGALSGFIASSLFIALSPLEFPWNPLDWGHLSILPSFFILTGLLVGFISSQQKQKQSENQGTIDKLNTQLKELNQITDQLTRSNLNLEKKIVFRLETFQSIYEIAEQLNKLHLDQLYKSIPQLIAKYFHAEQCSFFLFEPEGSLVLKSTYGWSENESHPSVYPADNILVKRLIEIRKTTIIPVGDLESLEIDAIFIVVLISEENRLLGMIKIEQIEFLNITQDNLRFLSLLSNWFIQSIVNGLRYAEREKESTFDPRTGLVREETFWFMVKKIVASAVRHKYETVLMNLSLNFPEIVGSVEKNILINSIGEILKRVCRIDDEVGVADINRPYNFMIMMPFTNNSQAQIVLQKATQAMIDKLANQYPYLGNEGFISWEILSLEDGSLFLSETVQQMIFDPILAGKL